MKLSPAAREQFRRFGRQGGRRRAQRLAPASRSAIARRGALRRWLRIRFGVSRLAELGLPGGAMVDRGLDDLAAGEETADGLMVALAGARMRREGIPLPRESVENPDHRLYALLLATEGNLAHARYLARLELISSFADACYLVRSRRGRRAR